MQREVARQLEKTFDDEISKALPTFVPQRSQQKKNVRIYQWKESDQVSIFLMLVLSPKSDAFTWEAAWSMKHAYPFHLHPMSPLGNPNANIPPEEPVDGEFRFRVPELWDPGKDNWWHVRGDNDKRDLSLDEFANADWKTFSPMSYSDEHIRSVAEAVIARIKLDAVPYFIAGVSKMLGTPIC